MTATNQNNQLSRDSRIQLIAMLIGFMVTTGGVAFSYGDLSARVANLEDNEAARMAYAAQKLVDDRQNQRIDHIYDRVETVDERLSTAYLAMKREDN